jgi:hypothetical protein
VSDDNQYSGLQRWNTSAAQVDNDIGGQISLNSDNTLCIDAGMVTNGGWLTLQECDNTIVSQKWVYRDEDHLLAIANGKPFTPGMSSENPLASQS